MDEEIQLREGTESQMESQDEMATFDPTADMSDDDIAAALGFHTTLSEPLLPMDEMTTAEDEGVETADESGATEMDAVEDPVAEEPEDPNKEQDDEIADIRKELEELKASIEDDDEESETEEDTAASE